jgi:hypothetical protein
MEMLGSKFQLITGEEKIFFLLGEVLLSDRNIDPFYTYNNKN